MVLPETLRAIPAGSTCRRFREVSADRDRHTQVQFSFGRAKGRLVLKDAHSVQYPLDDLTPRPLYWHRDAAGLAATRPGTSNRPNTRIQNHAPDIPFRGANT